MNKIFSESKSKTDKTAKQISSSKLKTVRFEPIGITSIRRQSSSNPNPAKSCEPPVRKMFDPLAGP